MTIELWLGCLALIASIHQAYLWYRDKQRQRAANFLLLLPVTGTEGISDSASSTLGLIIKSVVVLLFIAFCVLWIRGGVNEVKRQRASLQKNILKILKENRDTDGDPLTENDLFFELQERELIPKYRDFDLAVLFLREGGYIELSTIVSESEEVEEDADLDQEDQVIIITDAGLRSLQA